MSAQPGVGTVLPWEWSNNPPGPAPYTYEVPASLEVQPYTATATYDGTGASEDFIPVLSVYSQTGALLGRVFPQGTVTMGDSTVVTYVPPFGSAASSPSPSGSGIQFDTDNEGGWLDVTTNNTDPDGYGMQLIDTTGGGINLATPNGSGVNAETHGGEAGISTEGGDFSVDLQGGAVNFIGSGGGGPFQNWTFDTATGDFIINTSGGTLAINVLIGGFITLKGLPTANPGGTDRLWNNGGVVNIT